MRSFFKKARFFIRFFITFFKKRLTIIIMGILLGFIFFQFLPQILKHLPKLRKTEKIGIVGKYTLSEVPLNILRKISRGLTRIDENFEIVPDLCDYWEVSEDGKIYTFYFGNKRFFWHDQTEFKPEDINYNFKDAKVLKINSQILKIILNDQFSPLPSVLSQPLFKKGLVGLGDYKLIKVNRSGQILNSIEISPIDKRNQSPKIIYRFYVNGSYLKTGFRLGEINKIEDWDSVDDFKNEKNVLISEYQKNDLYVALFFNTKQDPFTEKSFRQAIAYAIDKPNDKSRALGPISNLSWAFNPGVKKYEKDFNNSKSLLSKIKIKDDKIFSLYSFPSLEDRAKKIQEELKSVGINTEIKFSSFVPDEFDMFLAIQKISSDPDQYTIWHTDQAANITKFSNPRIDKLLEDGRKTQNQEERKKIYLDFQRFLVEESPAVFLYYPNYFSIERK